MLPHSLARVNTVVMLHSAAPLAVSDIARSAALAYAPAQSALATLEKRGIIRRSRRAGRDRYGPNRDSLYYPMAYLTALVDLPVAEALRGEHASAVYAYGRIAQPEASTTQCDLDLLIVGEIQDPAGLTARLAIMASQLGRAAVPLILTDDQLDRAKRRGDGHVAAALGGVLILEARPGGARPTPA